MCVQRFGSPWAFVMAFGLAGDGTDGGSTEVDAAKVEEAITNFTIVEEGEIDDVELSNIPSHVLYGIRPQQSARPNDEVVPTKFGREYLIYQRRR